MDGGGLGGGSRVGRDGGPAVIATVLSAMVTAAAAAAAAAAAMAAAIYAGISPYETWFPHIHTASFAILLSLKILTNQS